MHAGLGVSGQQCFVKISVRLERLRLRGACRSAAQLSS